MPTDKATKVLLATIAFALLMIAANPWLRPIPVAAQGPNYLSEAWAAIKGKADPVAARLLGAISDDVASMETYLRRIESGICTNPKIC
jgi:hypothetical protein